MKVIHGTVILKLIKEENISSLDELKSKIKEIYGDVLFTNCFKKDNTFNEIMEFFVSNGKIFVKNDKVGLDLSGCSCSI
ncbi:MAG: DUF2492 family protein [Candidatus Woesearchaeota archaeon]|jgi:probable metal-binding protein|nr:DUF2492 family protein [Candidatus Woesearchaeota archaeon]